MGEHNKGVGLIDFVVLHLQPAPLHVIQGDFLDVYRWLISRGGVALNPSSLVQMAVIDEAIARVRRLRTEQVPA